MKEVAKLLKMRRLCVALLIITDILLGFSALYYYSSSISFFYEDDTGARYSVYSVEVPDQITVVDSKGETALTPNLQKIHFAVNILGEYVPVYYKFEYIGKPYLIPFFILFIAVYHAVAIYFLIGISRNIKDIEAACADDYESII